MGDPNTGCKRALHHRANGPPSNKLKKHHLLEKIGIIGIGKLGLCLALHLEKAGYEVVGVDTSPAYVEEVNSKKTGFTEPGVDAYLRESRNFRATTHLNEIIEDDIDLIFILVSTNPASSAQYDHNQLEKITGDLIKIGKRTFEIHLVIGCTTMPGYCDRMAETLAPYNYTLSFNPEFIAQGSIMADMIRPDMVLIGEGSPAAGDKIQAIYDRLCPEKPVYCRLDRLSAEISKLAVNCFLTTKIAFANAIGDLALSCGVEPNPILSAIGADSRIGNQFLKYGFGFGGPCLPRDNRALNYFARQKDCELVLSKTTDEANHRHLEFQHQHWLTSFGKEEVIQFDAVTFNGKSGSLEESQKLLLARRLAEAGRRVHITDRPEVINDLKSRFGNLFTYQNKP